MGDTLLNYDSVEISFNGTPVVHIFPFRFDQAKSSDW